MYNKKIFVRYNNKRNASFLRQKCIYNKKCIAMKQLLLTFFAVVLCYSLFFDNQAEQPIVDEINYIHEDIQISGFQYIVPDTMNFLTLTSIPIGQRFQHGGYVETYRPVVFYLPYN